MSDAESSDPYREFEIFPWAYSLGRTFLYDRDHYVYFIKYYGIPQLYELKKFYKENTGGKSLVEDLRNHLNQCWGELVAMFGLKRNDDGPYMYLHLKKSLVGEDSKVIHNIMQDLIQFFDIELRPHIFPRLMRITLNQLEDRRYMAKALCEYQARHGKEKTQTVIDLLFDTLHLGRRTDSLWNWLDD
jgi:hypothetical protein